VGQNRVTINRAPVLTLWGAVAAERLGFDPEAALTLGRVMAGLNAQSKGRSLGIFKPAKAPHGGPLKKRGLGEDFWVELWNRPVPAQNTPQGVRAVVEDKPIDPAKVRGYLESKSGNALPTAREARARLAASFGPDELAGAAYALYEQFRPRIASRKRGWGQKGELDLDLIRPLADKA